MMRRAQFNDLADITAFLTDHAPFAMFPLNNLMEFGVEGENEYSLRLWLTRQAGRVTDVLALTMGGMVLPCMPSLDFSAAAQKVSATPLIGILGPREQVRGLEQALHLTQAPRSLDHDEPHFLLDLTALTVPPGPGALIPIAQAPKADICDWMLDYQLTALNTPPQDAPGRVAGSYARYCALDSHYVLMDGDHPLSMTGFNARAPGIVQIGGVYTPPALRGRGHARRAVGLHLQAARAEGVTQATLFSASDSAARAYRALGFQQIGEWSLLLFQGQVAGKA